MHTLHSQPSQHDSMIGPVVAQTLGTAHNAVCLRLLAAAVTANLMKHLEMSQLGTPARVVFTC